MKVGDKVTLKKQYRVGDTDVGIGRIVHWHRDHGTKVFLVRWANGRFCSRHIEDALRKVY